jgi:aspartate racemase
MILEEQGGAGKTLGLMATRATLQSQIFERRLADRPFLSPSEEVQQLIDKAIAAVKAADRPGARRAAAAAARQFLATGAEVLVLACTELPIALEGERGFPCIDTTEALARACAAASLAAGPR